MDELIEELKASIIEALNLEDLTPADIDADAPLFGEGLGLDRIDALKLSALMVRNYGSRLNDAAAGRQVCQSVRVMAEYVMAHRTK